MMWPECVERWWSVSASDRAELIRYVREVNEMWSDKHKPAADCLEWLSTAEPESTAECTSAEANDGVDAGFSFVGMTVGGEAELLLEVHGAEESVYLSREMWHAVADRAGWLFHERPRMCSSDDVCEVVRAWQEAHRRTDRASMSALLQSSARLHEALRTATVCSESAVRDRALEDAAAVVAEWGDDSSARCIGADIRALKEKS